MASRFISSKKRTEESAAAADIDSPIPRCVDSGEQLPARRGAHGSDVVVDQAQTFAVQLVQIRRLQDGVSVN